MSEHSKDEHADRPSSRRRLLQVLAAAGASAAVLPERWTKPVMDSIVLPVHAQSSPACETDFLTVSAEMRWEEDGAGNDEVLLVVDVDLGDSAAGLGIASETTGAFADDLNQSGGTCPGGGALTQTGTFSGNLNRGTGAVSGSFDLSVFCGGVLFCTVSGDFNGTLTLNAGNPVAVTLSNVVQECCGVVPV